ncbi:MAG: hypothetical protein ACRDRN_17130 [Sciscionella sp.]
MPAVISQPCRHGGWTLIAGAGGRAGHEGAVAAAGAFEDEDVAAVGLAGGAVALFANVVAVEM